MGKRDVYIIALEFPPFRGGIASYSHTLARFLMLKGHKVTVLTLNATSQPEGFDIEKPKWAYRPDLYHGLLKKGLSMAYRLYQFFFFWSLAIAIARKRDREIVITSLFFDFARSAAGLFALVRVPYQVVLHGLDIHELQRTHPDCFSRIVKGADRIVFNSENTRRLFYQAFPGAKRDLVLPPLLDTKAVDSKITYSRPECEELFGLLIGKRWITTICRLIERKGVDRGLLAVLDLLRESEEWIYLVAGEGPRKDDLMKLVPESLGNRVRFLGDISEEEKFSLLQESEVFLMPTRDFSDDIEGFGISFLEATYTGNWVIGGDNGGVPEAVDTNTNGFLIKDDGDAHKNILAALNKIVTGSDRVAVLETAKKNIIGNFSLESDRDF